MTVTYASGEPVCLHDRAVAQLRDGRLVIGTVVRIRPRRRHVKLAFHDPLFRCSDGRHRRIRRLCFSRFAVWPLRPAH